MMEFFKNFNKKEIIAVEPCKNLAKITNRKGYFTYDKFWNVNLAKKIKRKKVILILYTLQTLFLIYLI